MLVVKSAMEEAKRGAGGALFGASTAEAKALGVIEVIRDGLGLC